MEVSKVRCAAVYSNLSMDDIATALRSHFPEREIRIAALESDEALTTPSEVVVTALDCSADDKASAEILKKKLESKEKDLKNSEESSAKAIYTIQTLHKQQQALYDEFVLLRQRYDEQKSTLVNILWTHCAKFHPDLRQVPDSKDKDFVENNTQLGDDILGMFGLLFTTCFSFLSAFNSFLCIIAINVNISDISIHCLNSGQCIG